MQNTKNNNFNNVGDVNINNVQQNQPQIRYISELNYHELIKEREYWQKKIKLEKFRNLKVLIKILMCCGLVFLVGYVLKFFNSNYEYVSTVLQAVSFIFALLALFASEKPSTYLIRLNGALQETNDYIKLRKNE